MNKKGCIKAVRFVPFDFGGSINEKNEKYLKNLDIEIAKLGFQITTTS